MRAVTPRAAALGTGGVHTQYIYIGTGGVVCTPDTSIIHPLPGTKRIHFPFDPDLHVVFTFFCTRGLD
jgi:hypothetical protein